MKYLVTGKEMKFLDKNTSGYFQIPELVLMEQAAMHFVSKLLEILSIENKPHSEKRGIVFCGLGNNGADGIAIARLLNEKGIETEVCKVKDVWRLAGTTTESYQVQENIYEAYNYPRCTEISEWDLKGKYIVQGTTNSSSPLCNSMKILSWREMLIANKMNDYDFVIDAIFGIGLSRELNAEYVHMIETINAIPAIKIAVDMPSGVNADNGKIMGAAIKCDHTITFSFGKVGQFLWPGCEYAGKVHVVDMGITMRSWLEKRPTLAYLEPSDLQNLPKRPAHSHKGTFGKLLIIAGSTNMAGAACFAAKAAYRSGVGLVKILTSEENRIILQSTVPEAVLSVYKGDSIDGALTFPEMALVENEIKWADAIVIGPGIGQSSIAILLLELVVQNASVPLVLDADALNILSQNMSVLSFLDTECIITPHLKEFSRLTKKSISEIQDNLIESAVDFASEYGVICVLKDFRTITAGKEGLRFLNLSGNNGMATGGSGDVLSGILGALLAQGMHTMDAASYGVFLHGLAGDMARKKMGTHAMTAGDLIESLKDVWKGIEDAEY